MSDAEIETSLDQFRDFEESSIKEKVFEEAEKRVARLKKNPIPLHPSKRKVTEKDLFKGKSLSREEGKRKRMRDMEQSSEAFRASLELKRMESHLAPEIIGKIGYIKNGLYRVSIYFINDAGFPEKFHNHEIFRENTTTEYANDWKKIIFTHYLGEDYPRYEPELGVVHGLVIIKLYVTGSDDLQRIIKDKPVHLINHIATPIDPLDRELGMPPVRLKN